MSSHAEQYTLYQIGNAPLREHPYPHILVRDVFAPELYRSILDHLLPPELMRPIKEERKVAQTYPDERFVFTLDDAPIATLPAPYAAFWSELTGWLRGMRFAATLFDKFAMHIARRFENLQPTFYNEAMLVDDRTRYFLGPHSDTPAKVITLLFYLPADDARPHLGTSIYVPRDPAMRCEGGPSYPYDLFHRVLTMPYVPNTLFAFFKTDNSFHGVEPIAESQNYRRHLLFYDVKCNLAAPVVTASEPVLGARPSIEFTF